MLEATSGALLSSVGKPQLYPGPSTVPSESSFPGLLIYLPCLVPQGRESYLTGYTKQHVQNQKGAGPVQEQNSQRWEGGLAILFLGGGDGAPGRTCKFPGPPLLSLLPAPSVSSSLPDQLRDGPQGCPLTERWGLACRKWRL